LHTDSEYLANAMSKGWARRWRANGWMRNKTDPALNPDLWQALLALCAQHEVAFVWVRGHAGNAENERCDQLTRQARRNRNLPPDPGYPPIPPRPAPLFSAASRIVQGDAA